MAEPTTRQLLTGLVSDVKHIKDKQDKMKSKQDDMDLRFNNIEVELIGTKMDPERGMVPRVKKNETDIITIKKNQNKIITWGATILGAINIIALLIIIWNTVQN